MPKIFVIIVTYNGIRWYDRCFGSLRDQEMPVKIVVIDNASTDGSAEYIKIHFPDVYLIQSKENLGFAKANNVGIRFAIDNEADYVFLLNQDAWVENDTMSKLLQTFSDNDNVGIASPIHLNGSYTALDHGFLGYMGGEFASDAYMQKIKEYYERPFVNAAAWLVSRQCLESVGGFDTLLFKHYGEDDNYCQRVIFHGFRVVVKTNCTICHDREERKDNDQKHNVLSQQTTFIVDRIRYGNINNTFDFKGMRVKLKRKIRRKLLMGEFESARLLRDKIALFDLIEKSRMINQQRGRNWL